MSIQQLWQQDFLQSFRQYVAAQEAALALVVFGSVGQADTAVSPHSDLDLLLITTDAGLATFFPAVVWLEVFGALYAFEQHSSNLTHTTRFCFEDMRRVDIVFMTESALQQSEQARFWQSGQVVWARDTAVVQQLHHPGFTVSFSLPTPAEFDHMVNQFWYRSTVAVYKVIRNDWLIAWHLSLELIQDCCVLGMMLRDRQEGTNQHRTGGVGNELVTRLPTFSHPYTASKILAMIVAAASLFDDLAEQWSPHYEAKKRPLLAWIQTLQIDTF